MTPKVLRCCRNSPIVCRNEKDNIVLFYSNSDNIDNVGHFHVKCSVCEYEFNVWECDDNKIHEMFGNNWRLYI